MESQRNEHGAFWLLERSLTGAETTADDRFRGLTTGRWCWRVGADRTFKSSAAKDWLEPKAAFYIAPFCV